MFEVVCLSVKIGDLRSQLNFVIAKIGFPEMREVTFSVADPSLHCKANLYYRWSVALPYRAAGVVLPRKWRRKAACQ